MNFIFAPIPFNKAKTDVTSIKEMLRRLKAGANVCLFAEGDRSFNGMTSPIALSTAKLAKKSGADLITYHFEGAYFITPRWAKNKRNGKIYGGVANVYTADKLESMSAEEILAAIERDLFEDAYKRQLENPQLYTGEDLAENLETVLYICPVCNEVGSIVSGGNAFHCGQKCGLKGIYLNTGLLEGDTVPFSTITEWDRWQTEQLVSIVNDAGDYPICSDNDQLLYQVRPAVDKTLVTEGKMYIDRKKFYCGGMSFPLRNITRFAVAGQQTLLFALTDGPTYEVRSRTPRSALKYREVFKILTGEAK